MPELPLVSVLFITYKRVHLLRRTLDMFLSHTDYPNLELIVTDDGSPASMQQEILELPFHKHLLPRKRRGMGANANAGLKQCAGEYVLFLQDDWECLGPNTYLRDSVAMLQNHPEVGLIRFYGVDSSANSFRAISSKCSIINPPDQITESNRHIYSDTPHLKSKLFIEHLGPYREDKIMEECEREFEERFLKQSRFSVAFFPEFNNQIFLHTGENASFRTRSFRATFEKNLRSVAYPLRTSRLHNLGKGFFRTLIRILAKFGLLR